MCGGAGFALKVMLVLGGRGHPKRRHKRRELGGTEWVPRESGCALEPRGANGEENKGGGAKIARSPGTAAPGDPRWVLEGWGGSRPAASPWDRQSPGAGDTGTGHSCGSGTAFVCAAQSEAQAV